MSTAPESTRRELAAGLGLIALTGAVGGPALAKPAPKPAPGAAGGRYDAAVKAAHAKYKGLQEGKNADYIPALAKVPSELFGVALVTPGREVSTAGDVDYKFSIQSISKVFTFALVMKESGSDLVENDIGVDATGQVFNSIVAVEQYKGKEMNPFVNPGAIATVGLVKGASADEVWSKIIGIHNDFAGRTLEVNQEVYKSESDTNQRNRAISMLMSAYERFPGDPAQAVDLYTRQCSINVSAKDLAVMGATLADGGRNPITGKQVVSPEIAAKTMAVMATAGLYDDSGKWLFHTGLPAKSGVGGGLVACSPGKFGIGTFAPPLDAAGNSVRGQKAIKDISDAVGGNPYMVSPR